VKPLDGSSLLLKAGNQVDLKLHQLVGEALSQKETMIRVLEQQLQAEKQRREDIAEQFKRQLEEFEAERQAIEKLRQSSNKMEKR
jgi:arginine deiminase